MLVIHGVLSGCYFTAAASLAQAVLPKMKFAQFASAAGIVLSVVTIVAGLAMGWVLDRSGHNHRLTFYGGGGLAVLTAVSLIAVHRSTRPADDL